MPAQTARSAKTYALDVDTLLDDGATQVTTANTITPGEVAAAAVILDFGNTSVQGVEQVAYTAADLVVDVTTMDTTTGDESYEIVYQLSDDASANGAGFDVGDTVVNKAVLTFGAAGGLINSGADDDVALGRNVVPVDNEFHGTTFRFARIAAITRGTTPILNYSAFLGEPLPR